MGKCLRICFGIINFLVFLGGCVLLGLSIWLYVEPASLYELVAMTEARVNNTNTSADFEQMLSIVNASLLFAMAIGRYRL